MIELLIFDAKISFYDLREQLTKIFLRLSSRNLKTVVYDQIFIGSKFERRYDIMFFSSRKSRQEISRRNIEKMFILSRKV